MRIRSLILGIWAFGSLFCAAAVAQKKTPPPAGPMLTRTITRHESARFLFGGTVSVIGAPFGSVTIEGWEHNEVDISAEIELRAPTEADLNLLETVNSFVIDADSNRLRVVSTGTHDRVFLKRIAPKFPKTLIGLPWKVDYHIRLPMLTDLDVSAGNGPLKVSGVEGAMHLSAVESDVSLSLTGGLVSVIVQSGKVDVAIPVTSWHGLGADLKLASGTLNVELAPGFSADINADILRTGEVKPHYPKLEPREPNSITSRSLRARAGNGGATISFTVGDGTIEIGQVGSRQ